MLEGSKHSDSWIGQPPIVDLNAMCPVVIPSSDQADARAVQPPRAVPAAGFVPIGRPDGSDPGKRRAVDLDPAGADSATEAKDEEYRKLATPAPKSKKRSWGHRVSEASVLRSEAAKVAAFQKRNASKIHRNCVRKILLGALNDPRTRNLRRCS